MDAGSIVALIFMIIMIIAHIIKSIRESAEAVQSRKPPKNEEPVIMTPPKTVKQQKQKTNKQRSLVQQSSGSMLSILDDDGDTKQPKRQALVKTLSAQGEGHRFEADPGTLDTAHIVAPTIDPTVKPDLESLTGVYEEGAVFADRLAPAITLDLTDCFTKPEGIVQAVILAEILNRPETRAGSGA